MRKLSIVFTRKKKLAWIDSLHPHRGIRADGEAISILSSKDGHLQGAHTKDTTTGVTLGERRQELSQPPTT